MSLASPKQFRAELEIHLAEAIAGLDIPSGVMLEAIKQACLGGGKRVRPVFAEALLKLCNLPNTNLLLSAQICIEIIHCSTLVHDDLPALDNDVERRGQPTTHVQFGEGEALLAGDALLLIPALFLVLQKEKLSQQGAHDAHILKLIGVLHRSAIKVCHGQTLDHRGEHPAQDVRKFKTSPLFVACAEAIDVVYDFDPATKNLLFRLAELLGDYFQRRDDFLDRFGLDSQRGRSGSSDARNLKHTEASAIPIKDLKDRLDLSEQELVQTSAMLAKLRGGSVEFFEGVLKELCAVSLGPSIDDI